MQAGRKRWSELSPGERGVVAALGAIQVALTAAALIDLRRRPAAQVNGDKRVWGAVSLINFVGPAAYFAFGRRE